MRRILPKTILAIFLVTACLAGRPASAQVEGRRVTVSGRGEIRVAPDRATVRFGVVSVNVDPEQARSENADVSAATLNALRDLGIEERKIQVNVLRIQPYMEYDPEQRRNVDKGFEAVREMTVVLDDLDLLPKVIARIVGEGANRISGIAYGLQDESGPEKDAMVAALRNGREKAQLMAETLGARLGLILQITEQGVSRPQPVMFQVDRSFAEKTLSSEANPDAYSAGEIEISAEVSLVFGLLPPG